MTDPHDGTRPNPRSLRGHRPQRDRDAEDVSRRPRPAAPRRAHARRDRARDRPHRGARARSTSGPTAATPTGTTRTVNDDGYTWFDFDCDYCTGTRPAWSSAAGSPRRRRRTRTRASPRATSRSRSSGTTGARHAGSDERPARLPGLPHLEGLELHAARRDQRAPDDELWALLAEYQLFDDGASPASTRWTPTATAGRTASRARTRCC